MENMWQWISRHPDELSEEFIMQHEDDLDWRLLSENYNFSIYMLRVYQHRVNWACVLKRTEFPESFLREMAPHFNGCWSVVSKYQYLSERFIHRYATKVDWYYITRYQNVSKRFLEKHAYFVDLDTVD